MAGSNLLIVPTWLPPENQKVIREAMFEVLLEDEKPEVYYCGTISKLMSPRIIYEMRKTGTTHSRPMKMRKCK